MACLAQAMNPLGSKNCPCACNTFIDSPSTCSVVFVHGLFGHPLDTWTSPLKVPKDEPAIRAETKLEPSAKAKKEPLNRRLFKFSFPFLQRSVKGKGNEASIAQDQDNGEILSGDAEYVASSESGQSSLSSAKGTFWPKHLLSKVIPETRIFTYGYDVNINHLSSPASQATVFQHAATFLSDLANERVSTEAVSYPIGVLVHLTYKKLLLTSIVQQSRPIVFVARSLGGIVVKDVSIPCLGDDCEYLS